MRENIAFNRLQLLFAISFILWINAYSAITINIVAPEYKNQMVSWSKKGDYITNSHLIIDQEKIDSNGNAQLIGNFNKIELTEIAIGRSYGFIYIDTATNEYQVYFPKDTLIEDASLKKSQLQLVFIDLDKNDINQLILDFNLYYDYFLYGDTSKIIRMAHHDEEFQDSLNNFKIFASKRYGNKKIKFFHNYIRYEIALLEQMAHQSKGDIYRNYLYTSYLKRHEINYLNDAYMQFFNLFYLKAFRIGGDELFEKIRFSINQLNDFEKLESLMANNQFFTNNKLREITIIKGLFDSYNSIDFSQENIISMLNFIEKNSQWYEHKEISKRCVNELLKLKKNSVCPNFHLKDRNNEYVNLESCKGKYTYINFFASWNHRSLQEMEIINKYSQNYPSINFISINMDQDNDKYNEYIEENQEFKWNICRPYNKEEIVSSFKLDHLPTYLLLNPNGEISQYPAYPPSPLYNNQSIDVTFFNIKKNNTVKKQFNIGGKN